MHLGSGYPSLEDTENTSSIMLILTIFNIIFETVRIIRRLQILLFSSKIKCVTQQLMETKWWLTLFYLTPNFNEDK